MRDLNLHMSKKLVSFNYLSILTLRFDVLESIDKKTFKSQKYTYFQTHILAKFIEATK